MSKSETTGKSAASNAGRVLQDKSSSPLEKSAAGSALTQIAHSDTDNEHTSARAASNAAKVLRDKNASPEAKSAAGSALTQAPDHEK